jgi:hypothetical protein
LSQNAFIEAIEDLRLEQINIDNAVLGAYGWNDIELRHGFYEQEYLPENDRVRFTICNEARREILQRLLRLNRDKHQTSIQK